MAGSTDLLEVVVLTTQGPSVIRALTEMKGGVLSTVCLDRTPDELPIVSEYRAFLAAGTGVIAARTGHDAYRVDVSEAIDTGKSWQLAFFAAHMAKRDGMLAAREEQPAVRLFATGELRTDLTIAWVPDVTGKLEAAAGEIAKSGAAGVRTLVAVPPDSAEPAEVKVNELFRANRPIVVAPRNWSELAAAIWPPEETPKPAPRGRKLIYALPLVLAIGAYAAWDQSQSPEPLVENRNGTSDRVGVPGKPEAPEDTGKPGPETETGPDLEETAPPEPESETRAEPASEPPSESPVEPEPANDVAAETPRPAPETEPEPELDPQPEQITLPRAGRLSLAVTDQVSCAAVQLYGRGELQTRTLDWGDGGEVDVGAPLCSLNLALGKDESAGWVMVDVAVDDSGDQSFRRVITRTVELKAGAGVEALSLDKSLDIPERLRITLSYVADAPPEQDRDTWLAAHIAAGKAVQQTMTLAGIRRKKGSL